MVSFARQYWLLVWKNYLLVRRTPLVTIFEVLIPTLLSIILLILRSQISADINIKPMVYESFVIGDTIPDNVTSPMLMRIPVAMKIFIYAPRTPLIDRIVGSVARRLGFSRVIGFSSEADMESFYKKPENTDFVLSAVVFQDLASANKLPHDVKYVIRPTPDTGNEIEEATLEQTFSWSTNLMYPSNTKPQARKSDLHGLAYPGYYNAGFLTLQRAIDFAIIEVLGTNHSTLDEYEIRLKRFPEPPSRHDPFISILQERLPLVIMLSFIVSAATICKDIVEEKEKKLKESMKLMGMKPYLYWFAWMLKFVSLMIISVAIMTLIFHVKTKKGAMITYTHPSITFIFLMLFGITVIVLCCAISTFFSHSSSAAAAGAIIYVAIYMPYFFLSFRMDSVSQTLKMILSLDINLAMSFGCLLISQYEDLGVGMQWSNFNKPVNINNVFTMTDVFIMLIVDIAYLSLITWYFDALLPGDFGTPQPFYFPFTSWYWYGRPRKIVSSTSEHADRPYHGDRAEFFEQQHQNSEVGIRIRHLRKVFEGSVKPSVVDLSVDMYIGEITALLGHNGAGKTTTMYMLTGFLPPTEGTAFINGLDIRKDMVRIRQSLGLCPQHDILFDKLTVVEHLEFFAKLKGCPASEVNKEVDDMVAVLHLENKRKTFSKNLSGGMKRKLSVGIALIYGSKFVILDEPTSGMDPQSRRETWDILQSQRKDRTIILSTHFMDEADLLGDRIAIMADGELKCCGSSMFLKKKYGIGYHLTIVRNRQSKSKRISKLIKTFISHARLEGKVGAELAYILPQEMVFQFEDLFNAIERNRQSLGIDSYGASVTTMEEVFIRVGEPGEPAVKKMTPVDHAVGMMPAKVTISGMPASTDLVPSEPSVSSVMTIDRPASTSFLNRNSRSISTTFYNEQNSSLLSYLTTKLAKLKESRVKKSSTSIEPRKTMAKMNATGVEASASDSMSIMSEAMSEASDTDWDELPAAEASKKPSSDWEKSTKSFAPRSSRMSPISAMLSGDSRKPSLMSRIRREVSNPEMKKISELSEISDQHTGSFLKGVPEDEMEVSKISLASSDSSAETGEAIFVDFVVVTGVHLLLQHYRAMLMKRIIHSWRNRIITVVQLLVPLIFLAIGCVIIEYSPSSSETVPLELSLSRFKHTEVPVTIESTTASRETAASIRDMYVRILEGSSSIHNVEDQSIDNYLLQLAAKDMEHYKRYVVLGGTFSAASEFNKSIIGHFKNDAFHVISISLSLIDLTLLKQLIGRDYSITTTNYPLPASISSETTFKIVAQRMAGFVLSYTLTFGLAFLLGTFILFPIKEQTVGSRRLQFVSGIRAVNYWMSAFIWDIVTYLFPALLILLIIHLFNIQPLRSNHNLKYVFILLMLYAWAMLPLTYLESFGFSEAAAGFAWSTIINILTDTIAMIVVYILKMPEIEIIYVADALDWFFYVTLPNYCFSGGILSLFENQVNIDLCGMPEMKLLCNAIRNTNKTNLCCKGNCGNLCAVWNTNYVGMNGPGIGRSILFLSLHGALYFVILIIVEAVQTNLKWRRILAQRRFSLAVDQDPVDRTVEETGQDSDVITEKKHIMETPIQELIKDHILVVREVSKIFHNDFVAVDRLTIGVKPKECFGLLGINGAGKTTTFKMMTGDLLMTSGQCFLNGHDISYQISKAYTVLGYCPQFDALIDQMTVIETLWMYSRLRGITEKDIPAVVNNLITLVLLEKHKHKQAINLSGGNRRKLSTAIALTGNPKIVFLDEPTTGMDPAARRLLWNTLAKVRDSGRTLVLTSHSMEECEALCTRLAIMVNGRFKCIGSKQHLKTKFGRGYTVIVKVRSTGDLAAVPEKVKRLIEYFTEKFPGSTLKDRHEGLVHFHVHTVGATWANIFGTMERIKVDFDIEDYSVSQTTLEQVFVSFARVQEPKDVPKITRALKCVKVCCPKRKITPES